MSPPSSVTGLDKRCAPSPGMSNPKLVCNERSDGPLSCAQDGRLGVAAGKMVDDTSNMSMSRLALRNDISDVNRLEFARMAARMRGVCTKTERRGRAGSQVAVCGQRDTGAGCAGGSQPRRIKFRSKESKRSVCKQ
ncbi:hypothetical protein E4U55_004123 [Claviceps digitariae]|nr:hypothetical protein E4U55_004123 [Claviceps digitariae]